jgi:hypothetical protein
VDAGDDVADIPMCLRRGMTKVRTARIIDATLLDILEYLVIDVRVVGLASE